MKQIDFVVIKSRLQKIFVICDIAANESRILTPEEQDEIYDLAGWHLERGREAQK